MVGQLPTIGQYKPHILRRDYPRKTFTNIKYNRVRMKHLVTLRKNKVNVSDSTVLTNDDSRLTTTSNVSPSGGDVCNITSSVVDMCNTASNEPMDHKWTLTLSREYYLLCGVKVVLSVEDSSMKPWHLILHPSYSTKKNIYIYNMALIIYKYNYMSQKRSFAGPGSRYNILYFTKSI